MKINLARPIYYLLLLPVLAVLIIVCTGNNSTKAPDQKTGKAYPQQPKDKPIIIWFHNGATDPPESLATALSSGLINHVIILYLHRADADWRAKREVVEAIEIAKKSGAKLIWSRTLWPLRNNDGIRSEDLFEPNYYVGEIRSIRSEAAQMGADLVAFDTEVYSSSSPMQAYAKKQIILKTSDIHRLESVIRDAIKVAGKVDFVYPAGYPGNLMPYVTLAELGTYRISESTYYCNYNVINGFKTPYEIFGAYVNTAKENPERPSSPFFTISQIFEESWLWSGKKGLFIYPKEGRTLVMARQLAAYANSLPRTDLTIGTEVNSSQQTGE